NILKENVPIRAVQIFNLISRIRPGPASKVLNTTIYRMRLRGELVTTGSKGQRTYYLQPQMALEPSRATVPKPSRARGKIAYKARAAQFFRENPSVHNVSETAEAIQCGNLNQ